MDKFVKPEVEIIDINKEEVIATSAGPSEQCTMDDILAGTCSND